MLLIAVDAAEKIWNSASDSLTAAEVAVNKHEWYVVIPPKDVPPAETLDDPHARWSAEATVFG